MFETQHSMAHPVFSKCITSLYSLEWQVYENLYKTNTDIHGKTYTQNIRGLKGCNPTPPPLA